MALRYNVDLSLKEIELVKRGNESGLGGDALFFDPLFIDWLEAYYKYLGIKKANTKAIGDRRNIEEAVKDIITKKLVDDFPFAMSSNPVRNIQEAINLVCDAYGFYSGIPELIKR